MKNTRTGASFFLSEKKSNTDSEISVNKKMMKYERSC